MHQGSTAPREVRHARTPLVRCQIRGLRAAVQHGAALALSAPEHDRIGHLLAANMNAGFALELGLKLFAMTFAQTVPQGHHLKMLYDALPDQIRGDIASSYENAIQEANVTVASFALQVSAVQPNKPSGSLTGAIGWATASTFFESANRTFVQARYFYEEVGDGAWAAIDHPAVYLVAMVDTLDAVYSSLSRSWGVWAAAFLHHLKPKGWGAFDLVPIRRRSVTLTCVRVQVTTRPAVSAPDPETSSG